MQITDIHSEEELLREIEQEDNWLENLDDIALEGISEMLGTEEEEEDLLKLDEESFFH